MVQNPAYRWLIILIWGLVVLGVVTITSVSVYESHQLMVKMHGPEFCESNNCNGFYLWRHVKHVVMAIPVFLLGLLVPVQAWRKLALPLFLFAMGLLAVLLISSIGGQWGTSRSWINIPFLPSIQPSEMMKVALIFYLAIWMEKKEKTIQTWGSGFMPFAILMLPPVFLLALQPDFGSLLVISVLTAAMFFAAGGNMLHIFTGGMGALAIAFPVILAHPYILRRFTVFLDPASQDGDAAYQVYQSLITAGSGRLFGLGVGGSGQRHGWLPEVQSDTIFAAMSEELGFLRMMLVVGAFIAIAVIGMEVAKNARTRFEMLVATGITAWITFQALLNMMVTLAMFPLTGITLPFISYGGSSMLSLLFASGVLVQIAKYSVFHAHSPAFRRIGRAYLSRARYRSRTPETRS